MLIMFLRKRYYCLKWNAEVSVEVTYGYHSCLPYIATIRRKTPLVFLLLLSAITIFCNPSVRIQQEMLVSELRSQGQ